MFNGGKMAWLKEWFLESYKWEKNTIKPASCRLIWINVYGLPLQLWNSSNFSKLGQRWGNVISISDDTIKGISSAVGKVLISTSQMEMINEVVTVESKGILHQVRVIEEQMVVNTFIQADCSCPGCKIQETLHVDEEEDEDDVDDKDKRKNDVDNEVLQLEVVAETEGGRWRNLLRTAWRWWLTQLH